jgi:hypothetical protein
VNQRDSVNEPRESLNYNGFRFITTILANLSSSDCQSSGVHTRILRETFLRRALYLKIRTKYLGVRSYAERGEVGRMSGKTWKLGVEERGDFRERRKGR